MLARGLAIWSGVGLGHLAVLGALWSGSAAPVADPLLVDLLADASPAPLSLSGPPSPTAASVVAPLAAAPVSAVPSAVSPRPASSSLSPTVTFAGAPRGSSSPPIAVAGEAEGAPPRFLDRVEPAYPPLARRAGVEGSVTLRLRLSAGGRLVSAEVAASSGSPTLDQAALAAARASRYAPAVAAGAPVASETVATYRFELR